MLLMLSCLAVVSHAEVCIEEFYNQIYPHDPPKEPIFDNITYKGEDINCSLFSID